MAKRFDLAKKYTQKYKHLLPPCKYCGNTDIRIVSDRTILVKPRNVWSVCCSTPSCDCTAEFVRVQDAVDAWNRRVNAS